MKVKKTEVFFYLSFICLYISLFLGDIYPINIITTLARILRVAAYVTIALQVSYYKLSIKGWVKFVAIFVVTLIYGMITRDLYWSILVIYVYASKNIQQDRILRTSMHLLLACTIGSLLLCSVGILPDVMTARNTDFVDTFVRHSFGFYHSNVLPLITFYFELYYIFLKKEKTNSAIVLMFFLDQILLFILCNSRNSFYLSIILTGLILFEKNVGIKKIFRKIFYLCVKYTLPVLSGFSFTMMFLLLKGGIWNTVDTIFSGRFRLAIFKMRRVGLHLINIMSNEDFLSDNIIFVNGKLLDTVVLDNGYLYIILRYGVLAILFYFVVSFLLTQKAQNNVYALIVLLLVFLANFIDNDLVDYSFLPFVLIAFDNFNISTTLSKVRIKFL